MNLISFHWLEGSAMLLLLQSIKASILPYLNSKSSVCETVTEIILSKVDPSSCGFWCFSIPKSGAQQEDQNVGILQKSCKENSFSLFRPSLLWVWLVACFAQIYAWELEIKAVEMAHLCEALASAAKEFIFKKMGRKTHAELRALNGAVN